MVYVDTSVALAQLLAEDRCPPASVWQSGVVSSRLTEYEVWTRVHGRKLGPSHGESVRLLLGRFAWLELKPLVLARALEPWPSPVRTLDALHLASIEFLRSRGQDVMSASWASCTPSSSVVSSRARVSRPATARTSGSSHPAISCRLSGRRVSAFPWPGSTIRRSRCRAAWAR